MKAKPASLLCFILLTSSLILSAGTARAALTTNSWTLAGGGKWESVANWSSGSAPSLSDAADYITNAAPKTVTIDATTTNTPTTMMVSNLYIAGTASSTNTLFLNNAGTATPLWVLGTNVVLTLNLHGALVVNNSAIVATNGAQLGLIYVGNSGGSASLTISNGGVVSGDNGYVGLTSSSNTVLVTGSGSVWNSTNLIVGVVGGLNQMIISNGGAVYSGSGFVGESPSNTVLVTGSGSIWNCSSLYVGESAASNALTISNGGAVYDQNGYVGYGKSNNMVLVTGAGSVWNSVILNVGFTSGGANQMIISNGGAVYSGSGSAVGSISSSNNTVLVTDPGSIWNCSSLYVGQSAASNRLAISNGGTVSVPQVIIGSSALGPTSSNNNNNVIQVTGGNLVVTSGGSGQLVVSQVGGKGTLILSSGSVTVDRLVLTNGANSVFAFDAGTLTSGKTFVTNNQLFVVGDGTDAATFQINGGVHNFANNLEIRSNATLTGCGTINGSVTIDQGGTVLASCGALTVSGIITNNGLMQAIGGSVLEAYGAVINNGTIDVVDGSARFHFSFTNNGVVLAPLQVVGIAKEGSDIRITWTTSSGKTNELQATAGGVGGIYNTNSFAGIFTVTNTVTTTTNYLDVGATTNAPARYYRVRLVP
jgi:T5SS/PEP-CTERM-associated repeat protein